MFHYYELVVARAVFTFSIYFNKWFKKVTKLSVLIIDSYFARKIAFPREVHYHFISVAKVLLHIILLDIFGVQNLEAACFRVAIFDFTAIFYTLR
jgi:hypothetical protein